MAFRSVVGHFIRSFLRKQGFSLVADWQELTFTQSKYLERLLHHLIVDCVLDVGANRGQFRDFLRREVGYMGLIVSFEPVPENIAHLQMRAQTDDAWIIQPYALGAAPGDATFNVMHSTLFSSFLEPDSSNVREFGVSNSINKSITVEVRTLDNILDQLKPKHRLSSIYLKMDTQGYDLQVVKGLNSWLKSIVALQTEASVLGLYKGAPDYRTAIDTLQEKGFLLSGIFPVSDSAFPLLVEFDCHMVAQRCVKNLLN